MTMPNQTYREVLERVGTPPHDHPPAYWEEKAHTAQAFGRWAEAYWLWHAAARSSAGRSRSYMYECRAETAWQHANS
jgi:hypothetical protein